MMTIIGLMKMKLENGFSILLISLNAVPSIWMICITFQKEEESERRQSVREGNHGLVCVDHFRTLLLVSKHR